MPEHWCSREIARHYSLSLPLRLRSLSLVVLQQTAQPLPTPHRCLSISCSLPLQRKQNQILFTLVVALLVVIRGDSGQAYVINDTGEVAGGANLPGAMGCDVGAPEHAFLWKNGGMTDLGAPDDDECSYAQAINSKPQIVEAGSECSDGLDHASHAFLSESAMRP